MQLSIHQSVQQFGPVQCLKEACTAAIDFSGAVFFAEADLKNVDRLAHCIADMELRCEQLRLIAGTGLVDLHKVEALARLQERLRLIESRSNTSTNL